MENNASGSGRNLVEETREAEVMILYDNEITSLIDIYFLRISFIPSEPF